MKNNICKFIISIAFIFLIRAVFIFAYGPSAVPIGGDHSVYHSTAIKLSTDHNEWTRPGSEFGYRAPLYFVLLSSVYSMAKEPKYKSGQLISAAIGTVNCILLFFIVRRYRDEQAAWVSFWIRGLFPTFIISDTFVLSEPLFNIFLLLAVLIVSNTSKALTLLQWAGTGICMALCILTREAALFYPFLFMIFLIYHAKGFNNVLRYTLAYVACIFVVIGPWLWRNQLVWGKPLPLSYTAGVNLHIGNNHNATGKWVIAPSDDIPKDITFGTPEFNKWHMLKGVEYITENPVRFVKLGFKKIAMYLFPSFHREDISTVFGFNSKNANIIGFLSGVSSASLILFGIIGFVLSKKDRIWDITLLLILISLIIVFVAYGSPRYRDHIDNLLIIFMAHLYSQRKELWVESRTLFAIHNKNVQIVSGIVIFLVLNWLWVLYTKIE